MSEQEVFGLPEELKGKGFVIGQIPFEGDLRCLHLVFGGDEPMDNLPEPPADPPEPVDEEANELHEEIKADEEYERRRDEHGYNLIQEEILKGGDAVCS